MRSVNPFPVCLNRNRLRTAVIGLIFLFDSPITSAAHFSQVLIALAKEFPIIPEVGRSPAQPVFGNARKDCHFTVCGNVLSLQDYPFTPPVENSRLSTQIADFDDTLPAFLDRHKIDYQGSNEPGKYFVECPYKAHHTGGEHGRTDAYVFDDGRGWGFYCSHASCANQRTWEAFKTGNGIENGTTKHAKPPVTDYSTGTEAGGKAPHRYDRDTGTGTCT